MIERHFRIGLADPLLANALIAKELFLDRIRLMLNPRHALV